MIRKGQIYNIRGRDMQAPTVFVANLFNSQLEVAGI